MAVFTPPFLLLLIYLEGNQSYPQVLYTGSNPKVYQIFSIANVMWSSKFFVYFGDAAVGDIYICGMRKETPDNVPL